jgi:cupin fold WbuC family metalloprotein
MTSSHRRALTPPPGDLVVITNELANAALDYSRTSPRKRVILPFHKDDADPLHRMFNAAQPGSYVRPHRHVTPPKAEIFLVLRGALALFVFEDDGRIRECIRLEAGSERFGVDLGPGLYHCFIALTPDTLLYEIKTGPYEPMSAKDFAPWAPEEDSSEAPSYLRSLEVAYQHSSAGEAPRL